MNDSAIVLQKCETFSLSTEESILGASLFSSTLYPLVSDVTVFAQIRINIISGDDLNDEF